MSVSKPPAPAFPNSVQKLASRLAKALLLQPSETTAEDAFEIGELLHRKLQACSCASGFTDGLDLVMFVDEALDHIPGSQQANADQLAARLLQFLAKPVSHYVFSAEFLAPVLANQLRLTSTIGGPHELALRASTADDASMMTLSGIVSGTGLASAVFSVQAIVDQLIGAMRALRLGRFEPVAPVVRSVPDQDPEQPDDFGSGVVRPASPLSTIIRLATRGADCECAVEYPYHYQVKRLVLQVPDDLRDPETARWESGDIDPIPGRMRALSNVMAGTSASARQVQNACRIAVTAEHSDDFGILVTLAFCCIESLLLEKNAKDNVLARLAEAVAYLLEPDDVDRMRGKVKVLYDVRCAFLHTGRVDASDRTKADVIDLMFQVLRRRIEMLPSATVGPESAAKCVEPR